MSASVCSPESLSMGYNLSRKRNPLDKVKRVLFEPVDTDYTHKFIEEHLREEYTRGCLKWNFNFHNETTLDPKGSFVWGPPSPVRVPRKRKPAPQVDESSQAYFEPIERPSSAAPCEAVHPVPEKKKTNLTVLNQSLITNFMTETKRSVFVKDVATNPRPKKMAKLGTS